MKWAEWSLGPVLLVVALIWIRLADALPFPPFALASSVGPSYYPTLVSGLLAGLAALHLARTFRARAWAGAPLGGTDRTPVARSRMLLALGLFLVYVGALPAAGFPVASFLFLVCFLRGPGRSSLATALIAAPLISGLLWLVFAGLLGVPLPPAPWGR